MLLEAGKNHLTDWADFTACTSVDLEQEGVPNLRFQITFAHRLACSSSVSDSQ